MKIYETSDIKQFISLRDTNKSEIIIIYHVERKSDRNPAYVIHYLKSGKYYREDGPAFLHFDLEENATNYCYYYSNDKSNTVIKKEEWFEHLTERQKEKALWNLNEPESFEEWRMSLKD